MDVVQRLLMFEDDCILVSSHGKWGQHELDYLVFIIRDVPLQPNLEEVVDVKYLRKEKKELITKARQVKMKLHHQMNKHGPFSKKEKKKRYVVSLAET